MGVRLFNEYYEPTRLDIGDEPKQLRGYCPYCEQNVDAELRDCGIGAYEYWGAHCRHVDMRLICLVCDTDVTRIVAENDDDFEIED